MEAFKKIVNHKQWKFSIIFLILICSCYLGFETSTLYKDELKRYSFLIDIIFTLLFTIEIFVRVLAEKKVSNFFKLYTRIGKKLEINSDVVWNLFDLSLVIGSYIALFSSVSHSEYFFVGRLLRVSRIFRLFEISHRMKEIEKQIIKVFPTIFFFLILLSVLLYTYAIVGAHLFETCASENGKMYFSNTEESLITVLKLMTFEDWGNILDATRTKYPLLGLIYCISFIFQIGVIFLNVFVAILVKNVENNLSDNKLENKLETERIELIEDRIAILEKNYPNKKNEEMNPPPHL